MLRSARRLPAHVHALWAVAPMARPVPLRHFHPSLARANVPQWPQEPIPQPPVMPSDDLSSGGGKKKDDKSSFWSEWAHSPSFQALLTTVVGLGAVFAGGIGYLQWYKAHVLHRMERAFAGGYDPALEINSTSQAPPKHISRAEQPLVDSIFRGEESGGYYLIIGPKGTGKNTMLLDAMRAIHAEGASVCEAHPDLEVFRLRLGKALDFDFFEDWQGSLFSRADPRSGGPSLDIERAMTKLEKVALRYTRKNGRPLVLAFQNIHLFPNDENGAGIIYQLQQRAEQWAEAGIMTMIFTTDDFWTLDKLKKNANRMRILSVYDLSARESIEALRDMRHHYLSHRPGVKPEEVEIEDDGVLRRVYELVGGRSSYLNRAARANNMIDEAERMVQVEKHWMLSKIGLIPDHDDDVMDEQKWASCSWLLLRYLADKAPSLKPLGGEDAEDDDDEDKEKSGVSVHLFPTPIDMEGHNAIVDKENEEAASVVPAKLTDEELYADVVLPSVCYDEARRVMTRTDFFDGLDHANIISIDLKHDVRPESVLILRAAQEVVAQEEFDDMLDTTRDRVDQIEGLHRQSEVTLKEAIRVVVGSTGDGRYVVDLVGRGESFVPPEDEDNDGDDSDKRLV